MSRHGYGIALAIAGALAGGCRDDGAVVEGDEPSGGGGGNPRSTGCIDYQGLRHCRLGNAKLTPHDEGRVLNVTNLGGGGTDGVSVQLPDVTNFAPEGLMDGTAPGSRLNVEARSGGVTIGSMYLQRTPDGYELAASFTGGGNLGTYRVNLFRNDALVGTIANVPNGDPVVVERFLPFWLYWLLVWEWVSFWNVANPGGDDDGACVFALRLQPDDEVQVVADGGKLVVADRIELHEEVQGGGSYPYMTFDRMDYTLNGGRMLLTGESIENLPTEP